MPAGERTAGTDHDGRSPGVPRFVTVALDAAAGPRVRRPWLIELELGWYLFVAIEVVVQISRATAADGVPRLPDGPVAWVLGALPFAAAALIALARWWRPARTGGLAVAGLLVVSAVAVGKDTVAPWAHLWLASVVGVLPVLLAAGFRRGGRPAFVVAALVALYALFSLLRIQVQVPGMARGLSGGVAVPLDQVGAALLLVVAPVGTGLALRLTDVRRRAAELLRVRAAERLQVARELHDLVAGHVTGMTMFARARGIDDDPTRVRAILGSIETSGRDALAAMHRMVGALRAETAPDATWTLPTSAVDVPGAVHSAIGAGTGASVTIDGAAAGLAAPADLLTTVHRVVTEALTNVRRHAPTAGEIAVRVTGPDRGMLVVEVVNDGAGRSRPAHRSGGGYGLAGLAERVATLGGTLVAGPDGPGRWRLRTELPVPGA